MDTLDTLWPVARPSRLGTLLRASWLVPLLLAKAVLTPAAAADHTSRYDELWSRATLYASERPAAFLRGVQLSGRLQLDQAYVDAGRNKLSEGALRRLRLGAKLSFRNDILLHTEADYDWQSGQPVYNRLTDAYVGWSPSTAVNLRVGKHSAPFTLDGMTSSTGLLTVDRSNLANNLWFTEEYIPGVSVAGDVRRWTYQLGLYSSGGSNRGFGDSGGGEFWLGTVGYDFGRGLGVDKALLRVNLVDNEPDADNGFTKPLAHVASLNLDLDAGRWGLGADVSAARGYFTQSGLQALMVMPRFDVSDAVQFVARYTHVSSDDVDGVRFARYENEIVAGRGDDYREIYLGLSYYLYGHKLKLQSGVQYADMDDRAGDGGAYSGWAWTTGFRMSW